MKKKLLFVLAMFVVAGMVLPRSITVTSPKNGDVLYKGKTFNITWNYSGKVAGYVKIRAFMGSVKVKITDKTETVKKLFKWTVPASLASGKYKIRIKTIDNKVFGESVLFTIKNKKTQEQSGNKFDPVNTDLNNVTKYLTLKNTLKKGVYKDPGTVTLDPKFMGKRDLRPMPSIPVFKMEPDRIDYGEKYRVSIACKNTDVVTIKDQTGKVLQTLKSNKSGVVSVSFDYTPVARKTTLTAEAANKRGMYKGFAWATVKPTIISYGIEVNGGLKTGKISLRELFGGSYISKFEVIYGNTVKLKWKNPNKNQNQWKTFKTYNISNIYKVFSAVRKSLAGEGDMFKLVLIGDEVVESKIIEIVK